MRSFGADLGNCNSLNMVQFLIFGTADAQVVTTRAVESESLKVGKSLDGWMDGFTIGYWCCHRFKECSMAQALPYAGSTIAVRLVIPKNKTPPRLQLLGKHNHAIEKKM